MGESALPSRDASRVQVAAYIRVSPSTFDKLVATACRVAKSYEPDGLSVD